MVIILDNTENISIIAESSIGEHYLRDFYQALRIINVEKCNLFSKDDDELAGTLPLFLSNWRRAWEETVINPHCCLSEGLQWFPVAD